MPIPDCPEGGKHEPTDDGKHGEVANRPIFQCRKCHRLYGGGDF